MKRPFISKKTSFFDFIKNVSFFSNFFVFEIDQNSGERHLLFRKYEKSDFFFKFSKNLDDFNAEK